MKRILTALVPAIVLVTAGPILLAQNAIPAGTAVSIRTIDAIDSRNANLGRNYAASLAEPLVVDGVTIAPINTEARLRVVQAKNSGAVSGRASLTLRLDQILLGGQWVVVDTGDTVTTSKSQGAKTAGHTAVGAGVGAVLGGILGGGSGAAIGAASGGALGAATAMANSQRIKVAPETRLTFTVTQPVEIPGATAPMTASASSIQYVGGWNVGLDRCENNGVAVTCLLTIANTRQDRDLELLLSSSIIDSQGNKQDVRVTQLGSDHGGGSAADASHNAKAAVIAQAQAQAVLEFGYVDPAVSSIGRLTVDLRWNGETGHVDFRNVPLARVKGPNPQ